MPRYFNQDELGELHRAVIDAGLSDQRAELMVGVPRPWLAGVRKVSDESGQLLIDLDALDTAELDDNIVPFDIWLTNAGVLTRGEKIGAVFRTFQVRLRGMLRASSAVPDPRSVPETKVTTVSRELVLGKDDRVSFAWLNGGVRTGASVVKLSVPRFKDGAPLEGDGAGTGWVLAPGVIITCHHVIEARTYEAASDADFEKQALATRILVGFDHPDADPQVLHVKKLLFRHAGLDVALLEIQEPNQLAPLTIRSTAVSPPTAEAPMAINIIQHPRGEAKRLGFRNNALTAVEAPVLRYFTDTDPGSSGSPLCDDAWHVIGIHRASEKTSATKLGDATITYINVGHQMAQILAALKADAVWARLEPGLVT